PEDLAARRRGEAGLRGAASRYEDADRRLPSARRSCIHHFERADRERDEIARERTRRREDDRRLLFAGRLGHRRRIRGGDEAARHVERELPGRLEDRLVEAWERAPRVERLELREEIRVRPLPLAEDAARALLFDAAGVVQCEPEETGREISLEG